MVVVFSYCGTTSIWFWSAVTTIYLYILIKNVFSLSSILFSVLSKLLHPYYIKESFFIIFTSYIGQYLKRRKSLQGLKRILY
ncbi:hypothetical protein TorRG33x02_140050 [Trema orientale]|uniref:Uncharacterized protein n=1 Tax=Trema orientale TaxID=63057 RepID=A0A2P5EX92_TREOI|nr:hypothetical protein TorRG33x02_140050 [Trema orientale]